MRCCSPTRSTAPPSRPNTAFRVRLLVPGWYGMTHVKGLRGITALAEPFCGYQHERSYRLRDSDEDPGRPVTRMEPRSLIVPPGIPDFMTRTRIVRPGAVLLEGRAWSGWGPIVRVEVSVDGGDSWAEAELGDAPGPYAWRAWSFPWNSTQGDHVLSSRAHDATGRVQPVEAPWNVGGYANNAVQLVPVTATASST